MFSPCLSLSLLRWCRMTPKHGWKCFALRFANSFSGLPSVIFHRFGFSPASAASYVCHIDNNCERFNIVKLLCLVTWGQTPLVAEQADWQRFVWDFCIFRSLNTLHLWGMSSKMYKARIYFEHSLALTQTGRWAGQDFAQTLYWRCCRCYGRERGFENYNFKNYIDKQIDKIYRNYRFYCS